MSSIVKENESVTLSPGTAARVAAAAVLPGDVANRQQPVALEVPVTVNGARTVEGSDKREPFSESTKSVLVFGNGAVIRLSSAVAPGQLLFLTNEKTKKEVVCQVVKSKNYRNVSGYVELEFTEQMVGFWGMRFPGDRIGSQPAAPAAAAVPPAAIAPPAISVPPPKMEPAAAKPQAPELEKPVALPVPQTVPQVKLQPVAPLNIAAEKPLPPTVSTLNLPAAADVKPVALAPIPPIQAAPPAAIMSLPNVTEVKAPETSAVTAPPAAKVEPAAAAKNNPSDALKLEAARLQAQLSSLLFAESPKPAQAAAPIPVIEKAEVAETAAKLFEIVHSEAAPIPPAPQAALPVTTAPPPAKSQLDLEEMKIPSWLEPLARNVSAPASTEELIEREKSKRSAAQAGIAIPAVEPTLLAEPLVEGEGAQEVPEPAAFGSKFSMDENLSEESPRQGGSNKVLVFVGIAAGIALAVAGGAWYMRQGSASPQATAAGPVSEASGGMTANAPHPVAGVAPGGVVSASSAMASPKPATGAPATNAPPAATLRNVTDNAAVIVPPAARKDTPPPQPKKPALGEVHLATPTVRHGESNAAGADAAPAMGGEEGHASSGDETSGILLAANGKQPAAPVAPLPVGGDVVAAKLLSSTAPAYPTLAKTQHISGDVKVDALIDVSGRISAMKVLSGPTLLQQAAMDSLRQWKYQPAMLDGKPVPMHLAITVQFRLQQ